MLLPRIKLGMQFQIDDQAALLYNASCSPAGWMAINVVKPEFLEQMVAVNPGAWRIFRHYPNRDWSDDPERQAREAVQHIAGMMGDSARFFTHITDNNEIIYSAPHHSPELQAKADRYMAEVVRVGRAELGLATCSANLNTGHFAEETVDVFPLTLQVIQEDNMLHPDHPSFFCFHEYNWDLLRDDGHWHTGKFLRAMPPILSRYPNVKGALTELGIDKATRIVGEHLGWGGVHDDIAIAVDMYCGPNGLAWINDLLNLCDYMEFALIFGCGMVAPWKGWKFDIGGSKVVDRIKLFPGWSPPEPPPEPNGGEPLDIKVFNKFGEELLPVAAADMVAKHGVTWEMPPGLQAGERFFKLVALREKPSASLITRVLDVYSRPIVNPDEWLDRALAHRALWWPSINDGDGPGHPIITSFPTDHHKQADIGGLNANGEGGSGMGVGSYHDPYTPGGYHCWVRHPTTWSMLAKGQGMLGGTDHLHLDMLFQEFVYMDGNDGDTPVPPTNGDVALALWGIEARFGQFLAWLRESDPSQPDPDPPDPPVKLPWMGEYYNNPLLSGVPALVRAETPPPSGKELDFAWGTASPAPEINPDLFSARWTAVRAFEAGTYRFHARADDCVRLFVDDTLVIDEWIDRSATSYKVDVPLTAGNHSIRMDYYERGGGAVAMLEWTLL